MKRKWSRAQKRILMILVTLALLVFSMNLGNRKGEGPSLGWAALREEQRQGLDLALVDPYAQWYRYDTQDAFGGMALTLYQLNLETGRWKRLRGGEIRLDQSKGMAGFGFDGSGKLWAALYDQEYGKLAVMNPEEVALDYTISSVWWQKETLSMKADTELPLGVQSILTEEGARPIAPDELDKTEQLKNREGIRAAFALTVAFLPEGEESHADWAED